MKSNLIAATFGLALVLTLSCSDLPDFEEAPAGSNSSVKSSSSSLGSSSSSVVNSSSSLDDNDSSSSSEKSSSAKGSSSSLGSSSSSVVSSSSGGSSADLCADFVDGTPRVHYGRSKAQFCDSRDGKKYVYTSIGSQTWMAENMNYNASGSLCYDRKNNNCTTYGRLYNWTTARTTACPAGWHLPSAAEWTTMLNRVDPIACGLALEDYENFEYCFFAGYSLKTENGWADTEDGEDGNGDDEFGFSALPGGISDSKDFAGLGEAGYWWGSDYDGSFNYETFATNIGGIVFYGYDDNNSYLYSVRCVKNN